MCGICGVVQLGGEPRQVVDADVLMRMTDVMQHRGPDDRGIYEAPGVALGMRRLAIVDVAGGHQPFLNETGDVWAVQNGEIYNHEALRGDLSARGHALATRCDSEVLPHLYEEYGTAFAEHLRGMFGIAVWDAKRRRAVVARDRLGIKPIYWAQIDDLVVFASELKSLLASGLISADLDYDAIDSFLGMGFLPGPRTPLAQVSKLLPGYRLIIDGERVWTEQYWRYPEPAVGARAGEEEYAEGLMELLDEAVQMRLMSDVPLGAMLSGGIDSSLIVALMARHMSDPVDTFSVGFTDDPEANELGAARFVSSVFATNHHEVELSLQDDAVDLPELVWDLDEPLADLSALGFEALSRLASQFVTVALSGQGADELLGGYTKHRAAALVHEWRRLPAPLREPAQRAAVHGPKRFRRAASSLGAADAAQRLMVMSGRLGGGLREQLYCGPLRGKTGGATLEALYRVLGDVPDDPLPATLHIDAQFALADSMLHYFDRTSMAHSLEVRVPFLDHKVVEYCATIPADLKVHRLTTKYILKRGADGLIPDQIINKRKFGLLRASTGKWLQAQLRGALGDILFDSGLRCAEFLDRSAVRRMARDHLEGSDTSNEHLLIAILMLEVWLRTYLPRALAPQMSPDAGRLVSLGG